MLADDEPFVREGLKELISWEEMGYTLAGWYKNGREILDHIPAVQPDVVILDIRMPVVDGLEAARIINEKWPDIAVILLTAHSEFQYAKQAIDYQVKSYVMKRNVLEELPEVLLKMKEQLKRTHEGNREKKDMLRFLLYESEYMDPLQESKNSVYCWFEECFYRFRLVVIKGCIGDGENTEAAKEQTEDKIRTVFEGWEIQILAVSVMEYVVLAAMGEGKEEELKAVCCSLLEEEKENLMVIVGRAYTGIDKISSAYREILRYLSTYFLDWNESGFNLVWVGRGSQPGREEISAVINVMLASMAQGDLQTTRQKMEEFSTYIRNFSDTQIRMACLMILAECRRICREFGWKEEEVMETGQEEGDERVFRGSSITSLVGWLESSMLTIAERIKEESADEEDLVGRVKSFVENNYTRKLTLEDVAEAVYVNRSYLSRIYKQKTGENLFSAINRKKIEEAKRQMTEGNRKIWEIAERVGVEDTAYFSKMFKKYTGYSPREYERML